MSDTTPATWKAYLDGEMIDLPATIDGIAASLPQERRQTFLDEAHAAPASELQLILGHWSLETRPDIRAADDEIFARLETGDFADCVPLDDTETGAA
ncbi:hypothetical protein [Streptomyces sp. B6B3]|uniref:hypothetical protein n=1 Tax=Streptomyces sp. B6B3 TaxID=3153570 RepID=UPI00325E7D88